jgi:hypothetical protein
MLKVKAVNFVKSCIMFIIVQYPYVLFFMFFIFVIRVVSVGRCSNNSRRVGGDRDGPGPSTSSGIPLAIGGARGGPSETSHIGLAALQHKALKQQEQLEKTPMGFRFPLQMSPLLTRTDFRKLRQVYQKRRNQMKMGIHVFSFVGVQSMRLTEGNHFTSDVRNSFTAKLLNLDSACFACYMLLLTLTCSRRVL